MNIVAPSYSLLRMEEHPEVGGDTAWVSTNLPHSPSTPTNIPGLPIRALRRPQRRHEEIRRRATRGPYLTTPMCAPSHPNVGNSTNSQPDDTILDLWEGAPNRPPIDTHHPAVRTHLVTGLKALNVNGGFVTGFAELKKVESGEFSAPGMACLRTRHGRLTWRQ
jgi:hypothetical protein